MKIYSFLDEFYSSIPCILTIGIFDGVHLGHKKIIQNLVFESRKKFSSVLITFNPHPKEILTSKSKFYYLNTIREKIFFLKKNGVENLIIHPFTKKFSKLKMKDFFYLFLNTKFCIKKIIIGYDFHIGSDRNQSLKRLKNLSEIFHFKFEIISPYKMDNEIISSTKIKNSIIIGNIEWANKALGYFYTLSGYIIKGKGIGKIIDFPTSNITIDPKKLIPKKGVYAVKIRYKNNYYDGMMNIGTNPTIDYNNQIKIETNIFNFSKNIYGEKIDILIIKMIREEIKFSSIEELKIQIIKDKKVIVKFFKKIFQNL
ncbi:bifunctional riboflavin kinase/FAD synthetase [Blattabacterium cuenoti]|uniref:bifunctional riboflavin kinase/FAD synthetase n=1 Tax=Blattabacterium cuenoti TaxID=1653831 RepID=UPI00163CD3BE|nr:bifunctional riboflavin kinase/FAD synthetase [Blattabacterium cuenoti]